VLVRTLHRSPRLVALLIVAFVARGLIPAGFMPATHAGLGLQLMLCTADGLAQSAAGPGLHFAGAQDSEPRAPAPHGGEGHESPCAYAASASVAPPMVFAAVAVAPRGAPTLVAHRAVTVAHPSIVRSQSPRAPPAHA